MSTMSTSDSVPLQHSSPVLAVADGPANLDIQHNSPSAVSQPSPPNDTGSRPLIMYSRPQLLFLHKSPLVRLPNGMPTLKDWFGTENDQSSSRKDSETPLPAGSTRDRRFRRDVDDGSARQSFRGTAITQPSQMGNFKHQSIRAADRDRDRDAEKEQDRERVKESQERLRNLSDKYDRDRRALSSMSQMRTKDRELAPHLANPSSRATVQGHQLSSRASDSRDASKKKDGESTEDWRRAGADQTRTGRDRPENGRRDRDDRERPRSRARDSSRSRREGSSSRRDKEDRRIDRDDGYSCRRDRDDRDRDFERDSEFEDPRRWRDDGKRDERMAARRERELRDRRDRPTWDGGDRSDRRWAVGDDRDNRGKRSNGKERKLGEDGKDRDDRKDREHEKEPAWMDTYIPSNDSGGVIGGHRPGGELDGIQAFRKEMQQKDKSTSPLAAGLTASQRQSASTGQTPENQLDEIQLFRLMMKREEEKKKSDSPVAPPAAHPFTESATVDHHDDGSQGRASLEVGANSTLTAALSSEGISHMSSPGERHEASTMTCVIVDVPALIAPASSQRTTPSAFGSQDPETSGKLIPQTSRPFSTTISSDLPATTKLDTAIPVNSTSHSHPLGSSRLLALGSRNPQNATASSTRSTSSQSPAPFIQKNGNVGASAVAGAVVSQSLEPSSHFTPVAETVRVNNGFLPFDEHRHTPTLPNTSVSEAIHRGPLTMAGDRSVFPADHVLSSELGLGGLSNNHTVQSFEPVGSGIAAAKGSRFAKFFDGKSRDSQPASFVKGPIGTSGLSQPAPQKTDVQSLHLSHNSDAKAMEDIFAMLNNSAQAQRLGVAPELPNLDMGYGSPSNNLHSLQNAQGHLLGPGRVDPLYDDRTFVPDGMVPGLRSAPPRSRQGSTMFSDFPDEPLQFGNGQRAPTQVYQGPVPSIHMQHGNIGRSGPMSMQTAQFRGAPSPNHLPSAQRLPPGLANLGGRPPHEPNQFVSPAAHGNGPQPPFNNFQQPSLGFSAGPQIRAPHPGAHQLQGTLGPNALQGLVPNQAQLLGLAGANGMHGGLRGPGGGFGQQGPQVQSPHIALRQQQILPHMLPLHLQQQGFGGGAANQPAHDLMTLLMNGARRD